MDGIKGFFESFKEFVWDILGYILPGAYCLILMSLSIDSNYWLNVNSVFESQYYPYVIVVISYLLGYAVYGVNIIIKDILGKKSYTKVIENEVKGRTNYQITMSILQKKYDDKGIYFDSKKATLRDLRSIAMGFFPEQDQKVYTFAFRADIANHAGTISVFVGAMGLLSVSANCVGFFEIFIVDKIHFIFYIVLVLSYFPFSSMRNMFYRISLGLPFSLLSTSEINGKK